MLWLLLACTGAPPDSGEDTLPGGWIAAVLDAPSDFNALIESGPRAGWIALHANDLHGALHEGGAPAQRAEARMQALYADLDRLADVSWQATFETYEERVGLPAGSAIPLVVALSAYSHGDTARAEGWLDRLTPEAPEDVRAIADRLRAAGSLSDTGSETLLGTCVTTHATAAAAEAPRCPEPLLTEGERVLYNPLIFRERATPAVDAPEGLAGALFGARWSVSAAARPVLPEDWQPGGADDADAARDRVRAADAALDAWVADQEAQAPEGLALLGELELVDVYRSRALAEMMRRYLDAGQPRSAQAVGLMALDAGAGMAVGATNPPELFAMLATADVMLGRSREALDMLQPLRERYPAVKGVRETLGDLVVLEGMGSVGDSKEN